MGLDAATARVKRAKQLTVQAFDLDGLPIGAALTLGLRRGSMLLSLLVLPGAIFGTGIYGWWRRR